MSYLGLKTTSVLVYVTFGPGELCSGGMLVLVGSEVNGSWTCLGSDFTVQLLQCFFMLLQ